MKDFPRTEVGGVSMPRLLVGTNWFLGWSHCTQAKDRLIKETFEDYQKIADVLEVFNLLRLNKLFEIVKDEYIALHEAKGE